MSLLVVLVVAVLVVTGMGIALLGSVKLALARKLKIDEARIGGLLAMFGFTLIPTMLAAGFLSDHFGRQPVTIGGALLFTASLVVLAQAASYWMVLAAVLLLSAGWAALINIVNPLQLPAFGGEKAYATNMGCFIFGIGSFVTPLGVAFLIRRLDLRRTLLLLSVSGPVMAALACAAEYPAREAAGQVAAPGLGVLLGSPVMWLLALALFFYMPAEATMAAWATTYLGERGMKEGAASGLLSGFWLAYTASRLVAALTIPKGMETLVIYTLSVLSLGVWVGVVCCRGRILAAVLVMAVGIAFGPLYPTFMAVLLGHFREELHGRAVAVFFTLGGLGCTVIPMLIGAYARRKGVQRGFILAATSVAALCLVAFLLLRNT